MATATLIEAESPTSGTYICQECSLTFHADQEGLENTVHCVGDVYKPQCPVCEHIFEYDEITAI